MAAAFEVIGLQDTIRFFQLLPAALDAGAGSAMTDLTADASGRAVLNAPIRTGELRKNIKPGIVTVQSGTILGAVGVYNGGHYPVSYNGGKSFVYVATRMHRHLMPYATLTGKYNLGPLSASQPGTAEGGVGGGFISRAVVNNAAPYANLIRVVIERHLASIAP